MSMKLADLKKAVKEIETLVKSVRERKQNGLTTDADIKFVAETEKKADAAKSKLTKALDALKTPVPIKIGTDETDDLDDFLQEILEEGDFNKTNQAFVKSFVKKVPLDYPTLSEDRYLLSTIATDGNVVFIDLLLSIPNIKFGLGDFLSTCMYSHLHRIPTMSCVMKHEKIMKFEDELDEVKPMFKEFIHAIAKSKFDAKNENRTGRLELIEKLLKTPLFELDADEDEGDDCQTILSRACLEGDMLLIAYLFKAGFIRNFNRVQSDKRTPLMNAVIGNSADVLLFLLTNGADVTTKGDDGTALELAESLPGRDATIMMALKNPDKFKKDAPAKTASKKDVPKGKEPPVKPDEPEPKKVEEVKPKADEAKPKADEAKPPGKNDSAKKTPAPPAKPPAQPTARRASATADSIAPSTTAAKESKDNVSTVSTQPKVVSPSTPRDPKPPSTSPSKAPRPPPKGASPLSSGGKSGGTSAVGALLETVKDVRQAIRTMDEMMVYNDEEEAKKKGLQAKVEETKDQLVKELTDNFKKKRVKCDIASDSEKESLVNIVEMLLGELDTSETNRNLFRLLFENVKVDWPDLCEDNGWLVNATSDGSLEFMQVMLSYPHIRVDTVDLVTTAVYNMLYRIPCTALLLRHEEVLKIGDHLSELMPLFQEFVADIASSKKENAKEVRTGRLDLIEKLFSHKLLNLDPSAETDHGQTVFSRAAFEGDYELMSRLLRIRKAPDINRVQSDQTTALIQAVFSNSPPTVALILAQSGVNINHVSPEGTALSIGITLQRDLGIVQKLKSMGGKREDELPPEQRKVGLPSIETTKKAADEEDTTPSAAEDINLPAINKKGPVMMPTMDRKGKDGDKPAPADKKKEIKKIQGPTVVKKKF